MLVAKMGDCTSNAFYCFALLYYPCKSHMDNMNELLYIPEVVSNVSDTSLAKSKLFHRFLSEIDVCSTLSPFACKMRIDQSAHVMQDVLSCDTFHALEIIS